MCCLLQFVVICFTNVVCWWTWLHAFGLPSLSSIQIPLSSHGGLGNVIMHGNISQDGYCTPFKKNKKKKTSYLFSPFVFSLLILFMCLSGPSWFVFCSLKFSQCQKHRQPTGMTLQWMWISHLLSSRILHLWVWLTSELLMTLPNTCGFLMFFSVAVLSFLTLTSSQNCL